jgi:hypothetical protein
MIWYAIAGLVVGFVLGAWAVLASLFKTWKWK